MPRDGAQARARLREAALELYLERGYDATTAAEIAERAGLKERSFFRHFADKREVLFDGEAALRDVMVAAVAAAPEGLSALDLVLEAYSAAVPLVVAGRPVAERRARVISVTPALQERSHAKAAALEGGVTEAVVARGVPEPTARLATRVGAAAFERAGRGWYGSPAHDLGALLFDAIAEVRSL